MMIGSAGNQAAAQSREEAGARDELRVSQRPTFAALALIVVVATVLRATRLENRSLWFDEAYCWRMATFPLSDLIDRAALDRAPPLYYVVLKGWIGCLGESVASMRALSVFWGVAACMGICLAATSAYRLPGDGPRAANAAATAMSTGIYSSAFVAASVLHIRWSGEVKMYSQGAALAAFSAWLLLRALALPQPSWRRWAAYALCAISFGYTHNYAPFSLFAQGAFALGWLAARSRWRVAAVMRAAQFRAALITGLVLVCAGLVWAPTLLAQCGKTSTHRLAPLRGLSLKHTCYELFIDPQEPFAPQPVATAATALTVLVLLALLWRPVAGDWFLFVSATVPAALAVGISLADMPIFHSHYLQFAHLFLLAAVARLVARIPRPLERSTFAAFIAANMLAANYSFWRYLDIDSKPGARAAAALIEQARSPDEPIIVVSPFYFSPVLYYLHDRRNCYLLDDGRPLQAYEGPAIVRPEDLIGPSALGGISSPRLWAVDVDSPGTAWERKAVPAPAGRREVSRARFPEVYHVQGAVEVVEYGAADTQHAAPRPHAAG